MVHQTAYYSVAEGLNSLLTEVGGKTGSGLKFEALFDLFQPNEKKE